MRRTFFSPEFVFQIVALLIAVILVHGFYALVVRPRADYILADQVARMQADPSYVPKRSGWVIIRDFEQEACFVLMLWAVAIIGYKGVASARQRGLLQEDLVPRADGTKILPEDAREYARQIEGLPPSRRGGLLPRALLAALNRFTATRNIQDVADTARGLCEAEGERLESELSMVRYIAWAIPSIGFIGTVRGIGEALAQAHKAVEGDIAGVTQSLGVAFNSTFIALLLSIVLMFFLHQLQSTQERLVLDTESYLDHELVQHLQVSS
ncbi:MAG: MotA/TolQ/ExbB proton channel family protein [Acidobacteriota bacterium]